MCAEDLRAYWSIINVAVGLLLATAGTFLATILTAIDAKIRGGRHYVAWSLVCFTTTLLINLSQQISFATTPSALGQGRERSAVDMERAEYYLADKLSQWCTCVLFRRIYAKQQRMAGESEMDTARRLDMAQQRMWDEMQRKDHDEQRLSALREREEAVMRHESGSSRYAEVILQSEEAMVQSKEVAMQQEEIQS